MPMPQPQPDDDWYDEWLEDLVGRAEHHQLMEDVQVKCEHQFTVTNTDNHGNEYTVCEECDQEVVPEDTRSFYRDEETGRITW